MVLVQNWPFSFRQYRQGKCALLYSSPWVFFKNWPFCTSLGKGVVGGGGGVEGNIDQENVFCDILKRKNPFVGYKNKQFKKFKIWDLSMVLVKIGHFSTLSFLINLGKENEFYDLLKRKNAFLGYKNKKFKKWKNWCFSKGVSSLFWSKSGYFLGNLGLENVGYCLSSLSF